MKNTSTAYLYRRRKKLTERLFDKVNHVIRGSLIESYKRCGKNGCKCMKERGHGPKYYLSASQSGGRRPEIDYVPKDFKEHVETYISNFRETKEILETISNINRELLRRRKQFLGIGRKN